MYGGQNNNDLNQQHPNTAGILKFVSLYSIMVESFTGQGHCLVMDSAYMGNIMALIDKGNGAEAKYDLAGESHAHGCGHQNLLRVYLICISTMFTLPIVAWLRIVWKYFD